MRESSISWRALLPWLLIAGEVVATLVFLAHENDLGTRGIDFRANVWEPMQRLLDGDSIYADPGTLGERGATFGYPPLLVLVFLPLTVLPYKVALLAFGLLLVAASVGAAAAVGVRDVRCLLLVLFSLPVVGACFYGNPTPLVVLAGALAWRWRDRSWAGPTAIAAGIAIKFLIWPLIVWLALTGRVRAAARAVVLSAVFVLVPWAVIGFDGLGDYPDLLRELGEAGEDRGLLAHGLASRAGASSEVATAVGLACAVALLLLAARLRSDRAVYALALLAGLLSSPLAWSYYLAPIAVVIGLWRWTFSDAWLFVPALWVLALSLRSESATLNVIAVALVLGLVAWIVGIERRRDPAPEAAPSVV